jgi:hypothetical protein
MKTHSGEVQEKNHGDEGNDREHDILAIPRSARLPLAWENRARRSGGVFVLLP